jgi:hypothetical protein
MTDIFTVSNAVEAKKILEPLVISLKEEITEDVKKLNEKKVKLQDYENQLKVAEFITSVAQQVASVKTVPANQVVKQPQVVNQQKPKLVVVNKQLFALSYDYNNPTFISLDELKSNITNDLIQYFGPKDFATFYIKLPSSDQFNAALKFFEKKTRFDKLYVKVKQAFHDKEGKKQIENTIVITVSYFK